ncbi:hypothetical protein [Paraburkholderia strydomiana]|uniref:hypothetical protein n=1 Tax=Paraburkholderia strydomiana TaxID=1245417 RepID=UPI0038B7ED19
MGEIALDHRLSHGAESSGIESLLHDSEGGGKNGYYSKPRAATSHRLRSIPPKSMRHALFDDLEKFMHAAWAPGFSRQAWPKTVDIPIPFLQACPCRCEAGQCTTRRLTPIQASLTRADNKQVTIHFEGAFPIYRLSWFQLRALLFSFLNAWSPVLSRDWQRSVRRQLSPVTSLARAQLRPRTQRSWRRCHWRR